MKTKNKRRLIIMLVCALVLVGALLTVTVLATDETADAMTDINASFSENQIGTTVTVTDNQYLNGAVEMTTYYSGTSPAKVGYNGTPLILYVVNTGIERIGVKTDVEIISSMLERGYVVSVLDYKNNARAVAPTLDWSVQLVRRDIFKGAYFGASSLVPKGNYENNYVVPAGYDVSIGNVFWEADKHGADGTLEKIVENWNTDFRGCFRDTVILWVNSDGVQKSTQVGFDGSAPQWYSDAAGTTKVDSTDANAKYIKVQHTLATDITDCVGKNGEFIDIDLHMDIVYPTVKDGATLNVPIGVLANSSEYLCSASRGSDLRALHNGFLFRGYAAASFDYLWQPMAHADYYDYYDGRTELGALTGDRMNYGLQLYNDKRVNTAAMRYLRYLTLTEPETYSFDISSIGVFGNSKGGWFTFLGEEVLTENTAPVAGKTLAEAIDARLGTYIPKRIFEGHSNESRYDAKRESYVKNGIAIDGGELQPWLTYTDEDGNECEILSYASWIYASNGAQDEDITAGHAPVFAALHLRDDFSTYQNAFGEVTGCLNDIPSMYVVVDLGHTFAYGPDWFRGFDTYDAMFAFANYYLKDSAVEVIYTTPGAKTGLIGTTSDITVKFSGAVPESEIEKITLTASDGTVISGAWSAVRGNTEWTFSHEALSGDTEYTLTIPETLAGDNGKAMGKSFTASFRTEPEDSETVETVTTDIGTYFIVSKPAVLGADARIRFYASGAAANTASLYAVSGFDKSSPDSATVGSLIGSVNLFGEGYYEIDVTEALSGKSGECVFLLKAARAVGEVSKTAKVSSASIGAYARHNGEVTAPDGKAGYGMYINENINASGTQQYPYEVFYANTTTLFTANNLFGNTNITEADLGRRYTFSIDVYDTVERVIQLRLNPVATAENGLKDLDRVYYNFKTKAGEWTTLSFEYTVYEPSYGAEGFPRKTLYVLLGTDGAKESPIYLSDMTVTETTTPIQVTGSATLVMGSRADSFKESSAAAPFAIGSTSYNTLAAALAAAKSGETIAMTRSYTTTDGEVLTAWEKLASVTLDLGGYTLYTGKTSLIGAKATSLSVPRTEITVKGGTVYLDTAPLVSYTGSSAGGDGKVFDIKLTDVDILNTRSSALREVISASTIETTSGATVNFTLTNTDVRLNTEYNTFCPINVFSSGEGALSVSYKLYGGTVFTDTLYNLKLWDSPKSIEMLEYNGAYTTVSVPECFSLSSLSVMTDNGIASFEAAGSEGYVTSYAPKTSELSTKYGLIPEAYASAEDWPFVLFDEKGNFLGAYNAFIGVGSDGHGAGGVLSPAKNYVNNAYDGYSYATEKEAFILLRRNYTFDSSKDAKFDNLAQTQGTINIDLNSYSISAGNVAYPIIPAFSKGHSLATGNKIFPTTIKIKNGGLYQYKSGTVAMSVWDSIGDGSIANKDFNLIFDNVTFGFVEGADTVGLIAHGWDANKATKNAAPFNFTYNDCTFDLRTTMNKFGTANIFSLATAAGKYIKLDITVNGGKILVSDPSKITVVATTTSDTYGSAITFGVGSDGKHVSYYAPSTTSVPVGKYIGTDGEILGFLKSGSDGDDGIWTLNDNPLVSEYGTITETYKDEQQYPFALFTTNGTFVGGYATMKAAFDKAKGDQASNVYDASSGSYGASEKSHVILLRRNYTTTTADYWDNWGQIKGTITLDLNGNTLTQGSGTSGLMYLVESKGWGGLIFPSTVIVKNGDIKVLTSVFHGRIWATVGNGAMASKFFTWSFDNVDFSFAAGATSTSMLAKYNDQRSGYTADVAAPYIFNYTDCNFDLVTNAPASGVTLFNAAPQEAAWIKATVTVKGGTITAPSLTAGKLFAVETVYGSSVTFVKGNSGYTELYIKDGGTAPTGTDIPTDGGNYRYVKTGTADGYVLYTLSNLTTKYGTIPEAYASIADYPFIVFDNEGNFVAAATALYGQNQSGSAAIAKAMYAVLNNNSYKDGKWADGAKTAIILMRRDYTLYSYEYQDNLAQAQGEIIIDLNGYTLSESVTRTGTAASRNKSIFHATAKRYSGAKGNMVFPTTFTVKNGSIRVFGGSVLYMNTWQPDTASGYITDKVFTWNFENITFGLQKGATTANLITGNAAATSSNKAELGCAPFRVNLYGCVVDLASVAPTSAITVFGNDHPENYYIDCDIKIYGSEIRANTLNNITITKLNAVNTSSITFEEYRGEYTSLSLVSGVAYPSHSLIFKNEAGKEFTFTLDHTAGEYDIYKLMPSIETEYGFIPARYESAESYPFVVFRNGSFIIATNLFGKDATDSALHCAKSNGSVILMRRSFTYTESQYNNLSQTNGAITIDLGGFTLSCEQAGNNALLYAQKKTSYVSSVTVINGTILTAKNPIVRFASWAGSSGSYTGGSTFNIIFDGVTFGAVPGTSPEVLIAKSDENLPEPVTYGNLTVRGCTVELGSIKGTTLISAADASGRILLSARVENTLVYGDELGGITLARVAEGSSVIFGKDVKLYTKGSVTDEAVMTTSGEGRFVKVATDGEYDVYAIAKKELADFTVQVSVSLYSDFVYNIYVPKGYNVTEITVGGTVIGLSDCETVTLEDGDEYYKVTYAIGVTDAAEKFKVIVTVDGARATYTMSIPDYASRVIADTDTTEEERTLMYAMLSYVKAAYVYEYGDGERADAAVALIGGIIGTEWETSEAGTPDMGKPAKTPTAGIAYATLNLGARPALRLYIASGYAKEDITFGAGAGKEISYGKDTLGEYIDVTLYAYGMIDTLTFTVNGEGTEVEEGYNVYSYYEWATDAENSESTPELVTLVERFVRYCEAARAYRAAVLGK